MRCWGGVGLEVRKRIGGQAEGGGGWAFGARRGS